MVCCGFVLCFVCCGYWLCILSRVVATFVACWYRYLQCGLIVLFCGRCLFTWIVVCIDGRFCCWLGAFVICCLIVGLALCLFYLCLCC